MPVNLRTLKKSYLREAALEGRDLTEQIAWLEAKRAALQSEVESGDWAVTSQGIEGASHSAQRGIPAADRLSAVLAAMEQLEALNGDSDAPGSGALLTIKATGILS